MAETFQEYAARLLSLSAGKRPLDVLSTTADRVRTLIVGQGPDVLRWTTSPTRWSIAQIVAHLADAELVGAYRMRMILAAPGTPLQAFDQNDWARTQRYQDIDTRESLLLFEAIRAGQLRLLLSLNDEELDRFGMHAERGKESIRYLMSLYAGHDLNHLAQIERLLAERASVTSA